MSSASVSILTSCNALCWGRMNASSLDRYVVDVGWHPVRRGRSSVTFVDWISKLTIRCQTSVRCLCFLVDVVGFSFFVLSVGNFRLYRASVGIVWPLTVHSFILLCSSSCIHSDPLHIHDGRSQKKFWGDLDFRGFSFILGVLLDLFNRKRFSSMGFESGNSAQIRL